MRSRPDVLVLGGGGVLGLEWIMGVLSGIEDASGFDLRECEYLVGTSAGSIAAARLLAGKRPGRPPKPERPPKRLHCGVKAADKKVLRFGVKYSRCGAERPKRKPDRVSATGMK